MYAKFCKITPEVIVQEKHCKPGRASVLSIYTVTSLQMYLFHISAKGKMESEKEREREREIARVELY